MLNIRLGRGQLDAIQAIADEREFVDYWNLEFQTVPVGAEVFINSNGSLGWTIAICRWSGLHGTPDDLASLCRSLVGVGRKREREIAGRIRTQAIKAGHAGAKTWPGDDPVRKPSKPRNRKAVAQAWLLGKPLSSGALRTDGAKIWSWELVIGETRRGKKVAFDYRGQVSWSTSTHCGAVCAVAHKVVMP